MGRSQLFSFATVVAIINSVVGASLVAIVPVLGWVRLAARLLTRRTGGIEPRFPSP